MLLRFPEVREKIGNRRAQPDFRQQNRRSRKRKPGSGRPILIFPRTSGTARRKYAANSGTHEHTALFTQRNRKQRRCGIPVCSACLEFAAYFRFLPLRLAVLLQNLDQIMDRTVNSVSILKRRQGRNCSCRRWRACLCCFRLAQRPVLGPYASVGSTPSSLRTSSKAAAMALSMS